MLTIDSDHSDACVRIPWQANLISFSLYSDYTLDSFILDVQIPVQYPVPVMRCQFSRRLMFPKKIQKIFY